MLKVNCSVCGKELNEPGALLFSPPDEYNQTFKTHICEECYKKLSHIIFDSEIMKEIFPNSNGENNGINYKLKIPAIDFNITSLPDNGYFKIEFVVPKKYCCDILRSLCKSKSFSDNRPLHGFIVASFNELIEKIKTTYPTIKLKDKQLIILNSITANVSECILEFKIHPVWMDFLKIIKNPEKISIVITDKPEIYTNIIVSR